MTVAIKSSCNITSNWQLRKIHQICIPLLAKNIINLDIFICFAKLMAQIMTYFGICQMVHRIRWEASNQKLWIKSESKPFASYCEKESYCNSHSSWNTWNKLVNKQNSSIPQGWPIYYPCRWQFSPVLCSFAKPNTNYPDYSWTDFCLWQFLCSTFITAGFPLLSASSCLSMAGATKETCDVKGNMSSCEQQFWTVVKIVFILQSP